MISVSGYGNIMLDAGEGTYGQLERHCGLADSHNPILKQSVESVLKSLKMIFISHMHADHHLGAIQLLQKWNEVIE